jgi:glycerophosphoryl diester phosphodiesterase
MRRIYSILLFHVLLSSCGKQEYDIVNVNGNRIDVLGHGGMGYNSSFPLNSLESIDLALQSGANGTEMDVQLSKDSVLVLYHDELLETRTNGTGRIIEQNWEELTTVQYNRTAFDSYNLVAVSDVLNQLEPNKAYSLTFDCKSFPMNSSSTIAYSKSFARAIKAAYDEYNLYDEVIIEASSIQLIQELQQIDSTIRILYYPDNFDTGLQVATEMNLFGITISMHKITKAQIEGAHLNGLFVTIWQARTRKNNREAIKMNPDMIQSDKLKHLVNELN